MIVYGYDDFHLLRAVGISKSTHCIILDGFTQVRKNNYYTSNHYDEDRLWIIKDMIKRKPAAR